MAAAGAMSITCTTARSSSSAYDQTRDLCMTLQKAVKFEEYFRCYVIGQKKVHIMPLRSAAPIEERYVKNPPATMQAVEAGGAAMPDIVPCAGL